MEGRSRGALLQGVTSHHPTDGLAANQRWPTPTSWGPGIGRPQAGARGVPALQGLGGVGELQEPRG